MDNRVQDLIADDAKRLDEAYYGLGDALDVKASIILVVVTFLGTLSGQMLTLRSLPVSIKVLQVGSVATLCAIGVLVLASLWTKEFKLPPKPNEWERWVGQLGKHYGKNHESSDTVETSVLQEFEKRRAELTLERIAANSSAAEKKLKLVKWAFRLLTVAVTLEFASLIGVAFRHV